MYLPKKVTAYSDKGIRGILYTYMIYEYVEFTSQSREFLSVSELLLPSALALPPTASIAAVHFPFLTPTTYEDY